MVIVGVGALPIGEHMDWKQEARKLRFKENKSVGEITRMLWSLFPDKTELQTYEMIKRYLRGCNEHKAKNPVSNKQVVGVIADTHFPFVHPNYINFLEDTFNKYRVTRIVQVGDLCDNHAISRWQKETDASDAVTEYERARKDIAIYTRAFDDVDVLLGNHCSIPERQCATLGIPKLFLKEFKDLWGLPSKWKVSEQLIIDDVLYEHGIGCSGVNAALTKAINAMQSCVIGHIHSFGGCQYKSNSKSLIFGLNVGCGVDIDAYSFRYGKYNKNRETLGCGIVFDSANAIFVPMDAKYFRGGKA